MNREDLHKPLEAAARALARRPALALRLRSNEAPPLINTSETIGLPVSSGDVDADTRQLLRGEADSAALALRYHDMATHATLRPESAKASHLFDLMERTRIEMLGSAQWAGVKANIAKRTEQHYAANGYASMSREGEPPMAEIVAMMLRERTLGIAPPACLAETVDLWRSWVNTAAGSILESLSAQTADQKRYGELTNRLIKTLESARKQKGEDDVTLQPDKDASSEDTTEDQTPEPSDSPPDQSPMQGSQDGEQASSDGALDNGELPPSDAPQPMQQNQGKSERALPNFMDFASLFHSPHYHPYTTKFDEEVDADTLIAPEELARLRGLLDQKLASLHSVTGKLANKLQRLLYASQTHAWEDDLEEGIIDATRLSRVIINPNFAYYFKREKETEFRDTVVSLLIDNSGSMRGRPITVAAICADILARTLERCGVKVEILGFTTRDWKGGASRKDWIAEGRPNTPGRLNDLRHIVYKSADMRWQKARRNLGLMLKDGILKENIDGEAVLWAHQRLLGRPEDRRILMVISDGAPVDDSTLSVNTGSYLDQHLRQVIRAIEGYSDVELLAIGIGHDVTRYYTRAVTISDVAQLGEVMASELVKLFKET
jgi:cobaltochelatase CobT